MEVFSSHSVQYLGGGTYGDTFLVTDRTPALAVKVFKGELFSGPTLCHTKGNRVFTQKPHLWGTAHDPTAWPQ
jgi:hypothetical protein